MTKFRFTRFTEDRGSWWIRKMSNVKMDFFKLFSGFIVKITATLKGIDIKPGCKFFGIPHFAEVSLFAN